MAVIADRKSHIAPPLQQITGAEIERGIGPLRAEGRVKHGFDQILMVGDGVRAEIASAQHGVACGPAPPSSKTLANARKSAF